MGTLAGAPRRGTATPPQALGGCALRKEDPLPASDTGASVKPLLLDAGAKGKEDRA